MGREIRRVPLDWLHPRRENGSFRPVHNRTYEDRMKEWYADKAEYEANPDPDCPTFEECDPLPDPTSYRTEWDSDAVLGYCFYETVSAGTPLSPVLATAESMVNWLEFIAGLRRDAAKRFVEIGWSPSMVMSPETGFVRGVEVMDIIAPKTDPTA